MLRKFYKFVTSLLKKNETVYRFSYYLSLLLTLSAEASPLVYKCRNWTRNRFIRVLLKILVTPFYMVRYFFYRDIPGREGLAVVLIAKNEAPYIEEWINFHLKQGVSHFIIYDNESEDNFREVLKPYIDSGLVTYSFINGRARQLDAYNMALHDYGRKFKYFAVIDGDEFLFMRKNTDLWGGVLPNFLDSFMSEHPNAGGIGVNWCVFGSNGHITKPEGGVLENFTMCADNDFKSNHIIKTVCDPVKVAAFCSPHYPLYFKGFYNLDENGKIVYTQKTEEVHFSKIRINHYFCKSKEEWTAKRNRGMVAYLTGKISLESFARHDQNAIHDTEILSRR